MFNQQSSTPQLRDTAGIVLCGGSSIRMGMPKAWLPCGTDTFLQQIVGRLSEVLSPVTVVSSPDQSLPPLDSGVILAHDRNPGRGPLEGLAAGLRSLPGATQTAVVVACDVPLLKPQLVCHLANLLESHDAVVPLVDGRPHPLVAVYRTRILKQIEGLLQKDQLSMRALLSEIDVRYIEGSDLESIDPDLDSLRNINHPDEYRALAQQLGFEVPEELRGDEP